MFAILILIILLVTGPASNFRMDHMEDSVIGEEKDYKPEGLTKQYSASADHSPLIIESNSDFETNGWSGEGTEGSPYSMEGIEIVNESVVVSISNTDAYFTISDSNLTFTGTIGSCVAFDNVMNGVIENCTIVSSFIGVEMYESQSCEVTDNRIGPCAGYGIHLYQSSYIQVKHNEISDIANSGDILYDACIYVEDTDDSAISQNEVSNAPHLIYMTNCERVELLSNLFSNPTMYDALVTVNTYACVIKGNVITSSDRGMNLNHDSSCLVENNSVSVEDVNGRGLLIRYGRDFVVRNNNMSGYLVGYDLDSLYNSTVTGNIAHHSRCGIAVRNNFIDSEVSNNTAYACDFGFSCASNTRLVGCTAFNNDMGFLIQSSSESGFYGCVAYENNIGFELAHDGQFELIGNLVYNNSLYGISIWDGCSNNTLYRNSIFNNGVNDDGANNTWDNGIDQGNYWDDYSGVGYYYVPGSAGSQDRYPGTYPSSYPVPMMLDAQTVTYEYSTTGNTITWQVLSVGTPDYFEVYKEDVLITSKNWDGMDVVYSVDSLDAGLHNFTLIVYDWFGNSNLSFGLVNVTGFTGVSIMPSVLDAQTLWYEYNTTGNTITWQVLSVGAPDYFEVYLENTLNANGTWDGMDIVYPVDGLDVGFYNFTLIVYDLFGNSDISFGIVNVYTNSTVTTTTTTTTTSTTTTTNGTVFDISLIIMIISISSSSVIIVVVILIIVKQRP